MNEFNFSYSNLKGETQSVPLVCGNILFVLGANGVGKSALLQHVFRENFAKAKHIAAHRQIWFGENFLGFTHPQKKQIEPSMKNQDTLPTSRWQDNFAAQRLGIAIFNLISAENIRARKIAEAVDAKNSAAYTKLSKEESPIKNINKLFKLSNLPITITINQDDQLMVRKNNGEEYNIIELSDGERNALLIAINVLTAEEGSIIIIDEPERHLHRSIISPLLSSLFQQRPDCAFIISTHDVQLPLDNPDASILLVRSCQWKEKIIIGWEIDRITATDEIAPDIKHSILGAKRRLLFVEGKSDSLDGIYQILFPEVSIIFQGNCNDVERAVYGISTTDSLHWVQAFGLIDADDRLEDELSRLEERNIFALPFYSVESLYYHIEMISRVALKQASVTGDCSKKLEQDAIISALNAIEPHKDRLCARRCERKIRDNILHQVPDHKKIKSHKENYVIEVKIKDILNNEKTKFDEYLVKEQINNLIGRYPVRETQALNEISKKLNFRDCMQYEKAVRKLLVDEPDALELMKNLLNNLAIKLSDFS